MRRVAPAGCLILMSALHAHARPVGGDTIEACARELVSYGARDASALPETLLDLRTPSGGRLIYFGAEHSRDPDHSQFQQIAELWQASKPTVAFYEGPARAVGRTPQETIESFGESGYVRFLAQSAGARIERLEPSPQQELAAMTARFPLEQVKLFYLLREAARLRDREGVNGVQLQSAMARLLEQAQRVFGTQFGTPWTTSDLAKTYEKYWTSPAAWWQAPQEWFDPLKSSAETGGKFTNDINRASSEFRDRHMYEVLARAARQGDIVFAVVGRDHVPAQARALRCALR